MREKFTQMGHNWAKQVKDAKFAEAFSILKKVALTMLKKIQMELDTDNKFAFSAWLQRRK